MQTTSHANGTIIAAIAALACCNIAIGLMVQTIPLHMEAQGHSAGMIGLNTALGQSGTFLSGLMLPVLTRKFAPKHIVLAAIAVLFVTFLCFATTEPVWAWYAIRFATGLGIAALFTLSETWITIAAGHQKRARIMGIYMTVLTITFGVGPFVVAATGFTTSLPWLIGAACMIPGFLAVLCVRVDALRRDEKPSSFLSILARAPVVYICIVATTTFEAVSLSFFTIYGMRNGMDYATASQVLGVGIVGCLVFFYPIGQLADRWSRGKTATLCASIAITCSLLTALLITTPAIWPLTIVLRAGAFGVYIVAMTSIGDTFKGSDLVAASALLAIGWGIGGMIGPPIAGALIDQFSIAVLPFVMALCYACALLGLAFNGWRMADEPQKG